MARIIMRLLTPHLKQGTQLNAEDFKPDRAAHLRSYLEQKEEE